MSCQFKCPECSTPFEVNNVWDFPITNCSGCNKDITLGYEEYWDSESGEEWYEFIPEIELPRLKDTLNLNRTHSGLNFEYQPLKEKGNWFKEIELSDPIDLKPGDDYYLEGIKYKIDSLELITNRKEGFITRLVLMESRFINEF